MLPKLACAVGADGGSSKGGLQSAIIVLQDVLELNEVDEKWVNVEVHSHYNYNEKYTHDKNSLYYGMGGSRGLYEFLNPPPLAKSKKSSGHQGEYNCCEML